MQPNKKKKAENWESVENLLHRFEEERNPHNASKLAFELVKICEDENLPHQNENLDRFSVGHSLINKGFRKEGANILAAIAKDSQADSTTRTLVAENLPGLDLKVADAISVWITLLADRNFSNDEQVIISTIGSEEFHDRRWFPKINNIALDSTKDITYRERQSWLLQVWAKMTFITLVKKK